jgi:hypothetical protein
VVYDVYPKVYTPPLHFDNVSTGKPVRYTPGTPAAPPSDRQITAAGRQVQRAMDYDEIENLQNAYGYYVEKSLWSDIAGLFTEDGIFEIDQARHVGRERILGFLKASGPEGPVNGVLNSQLNLQPVIHVAANGRTASVRSRVLQLTRDAQGRPMWGGGIYENEVVKENGVWKFRRLHLHQTYKVSYRGGWAAASEGEGQLLPSRFTLAFHYRNPVSGR